MFNPVQASENLDSWLKVTWELILFLFSLEE